MTLVSRRVTNLINYGRRVPLNPLERTCPTGLSFGTEFFDTVAKNIHEKIEFKGVAFEGDCNNIIHQLPNDGRDAQNRTSILDTSGRQSSMLEFSGAGEQKAR